MKITLLSINAKYVHSSLAIWYLVSGVKNYCLIPHDVSIEEATINQGIGDIVGRVVAQNPDLLGISVYIWNAGLLPELLTRLRKRMPNMKIVLGGPEATHNPQYWLNDITNPVDYVIQGEGEHSFPALINKLSGLPAKPNDNYDYINPYTDEYFSALGGRLAYIETSRGCPFNCAYCLSGGDNLCGGGGVRFFPLDTIKENIKKLSKSGAKTIKFVDRTFNCNPKRAYEILEYIININTGVETCFHFEAAADLFDDATLSLLKKSPPGKIQFEIGIQSFHKPTLDAVSRKTDLQKIEENIKKMRTLGNIHIHIDLIAGLPYETLEFFRDSFDRAYMLKPHMLQLGFLKLLHGSKLRTQAEQNEDNWEIKYNREPPYQIIRSRWLSEKDLGVLKNVENALQHTYNKGRFLSVLEYVFEVLGIRPFIFFQGLSEYCCADKIPLKEYTERVYSYCVKLRGLDKNKLRDLMLCDCLAVTKGKSMPSFLKTHGGKRKQSVKAASEYLGRVIDYDEADVLSTGELVYVDSTDRDLVTGLYKLHFVKGGML